MRVFYDSVFALTPEEFFGCPSFVGIGYTRALHILFRLSYVEDPAWERRMIRNTIDVIEELETGADRFAAIPQALELQVLENDVYTRTAPMLRACSTLWRRRLDAADCDGQAVHNSKPVSHERQSQPGHEFDSDQRSSTIDRHSFQDVNSFRDPQSMITTTVLQDDTMLASVLSEDWQIDSSMMWMLDTNFM